MEDNLSISFPLLLSTCIPPPSTGLGAFISPHSAIIPVSGCDSRSCSNTDFLFPHQEPIITTLAVLSPPCKSTLMCKVLKIHMGLLSDHRIGHINYTVSVLNHYSYMKVNVVYIVVIKEPS